MNPRAASCPAPIDAVRRRGSAYVFVMSVCLIVTVLGMGALGVSNVTARMVEEGNDWEIAGTLAFSATEHAASVLNAAAAASPTTWRAGYTSGQTAFTQTIGRAQVSWAIKDETDGNLSADVLRAFRVYGTATVGRVTRVYSVQFMPGGQGLDVLRTAVHSSRTVTLKGVTRAVNGPISSNATVILNDTVNGAIEAQAVTGSAAGTRTLAVPTPAKRMPSASVFDSLLQRATTISYAAIGGKLEKCLLSAGSNPFGAANPEGIYSIVVPANKTLVISNCRISGTLLVSGSNINIESKGTVTWDSGGANAPILVVNSQGASVKLIGSNTWMREADAGKNLNPAHTPYDGQSNTNATDNFPPHFRGLIHVIAGSSGNVALEANANVFGTVIADCPVLTFGQALLTPNPALVADPPRGYANGDVLDEVPGSWRWDTVP